MGSFSPGAVAAIDLWKWAPMSRDLSGEGEVVDGVLGALALGGAEVEEHVADSTEGSTESTPRRILKLTHEGQHRAGAESDVYVPMEHVADAVLVGQRSAGETVSCQSVEVVKNITSWCSN